MNTSTVLLPMSALLMALPALAGPPMICHPFDIGGAKSLPWHDASNWSGADPSYNLGHLSDDTLALLKPDVPVQVRMETMRRAAVYSARQAGLAEELIARLEARAMDFEAAGKPDVLAWFDAGYFVESIRQAAEIYRFNMFDNAREKEAWKVRGDGLQIDGRAWVQKAIRMGGRDMEHALALMSK